LFGQSSQYWAGHYEAGVELNPIFAPALRHSPVTFIFAALLGTVICLWMVNQFPRRLSAVGMFLGALLHLVGTGSWLIEFGVYGLVAMIVIFGIARILVEIEWSAAGIARSDAVVNP